jgi:hypothetical protein
MINAEQGIERFEAHFINCDGINSINADLMKEAIDAIRAALQENNNTAVALLDEIENALGDCKDNLDFSCRVTEILQRRHDEKQNQKID